MISDQILPMPASDPTPASAAAAAIASPEESDRNPAAEINAGSAKARKPAWNVPPAGGQEAKAVGPIMGAATWPSLSSTTTARFSPKSASTPSSSSDSLKSLSDGSAASGSVIQNSAPSPDTVLVQAPPPQAKLNPNPNPNPNPTRRDNPNRSSKWNNHRRNYNNNNNNNYHHNNNAGGGFRAREKWNNNNNNNNSWNNNNLLHQRPHHFFRPSPAATPPPPPPGSFGFSSPPVPPPFYSPMGFPEFPFPVIGHVPLIATAPPQFIPQLAPPVILSTAEIERRNAILRQIEYYFSTENLCKDVYLRKNMDEQGWVPISLIAGFNRVKQLTTDMQYILEVIQGSTVLEVQGDKIRARNNWMNWIFSERMQGLNITAPLTTGRNT